MIEIYLNNAGIGAVPISHLKEAIRYAHTLCQISGSPSRYAYIRIRDRQQVRIYTQPSRETRKC